MRECRLMRYASVMAPEQCTPPGTCVWTFSVAPCCAISASSSASAASKPRGHGQKNEYDMGNPLSVLKTGIDHLGHAVTANYLENSIWKILSGKGALDEIQAVLSPETFAIDHIPRRTKDIGREGIISETIIFCLHAGRV